MSHEEEHERALFQKMSKELNVTPCQPNLEAKTNDLADNNVKIPYHHTPIIGNEIPKQTDSLGLKYSINGEPTYEIKENRFEKEYHNSVMNTTQIAASFLSTGLQTSKELLILNFPLQ